MTLSERRRRVEAALRDLRRHMDAEMGELIAELQRIDDAEREQAAQVEPELNRGCNCTGT